VRVADDDSEGKPAHPLRPFPTHDVHEVHRLPLAFPQRGQYPLQRLRRTVVGVNLDTVVKVLTD